VRIWVRELPARIRSAFGYAGLRPAFGAHLGARASGPHPHWNKKKVVQERLHQACPCIS